MSFVPLPTDTVSGCVKVIPYDHAQTHAGLTYFYYDSVTLGSAASQDYLITTPANKYIHFLFQGDGSLVTTFNFFEAANRTGTTLQTVFNHNRITANTASTTIHKGTSGGTTDGTLMVTHAGGISAGGGGGAKVGTGLDYSGEIILKQSTKYIFRVTSGTAGNLCNINMHWYEN